MASFSFGAGNARKLLTIPLYGAGRLATLLIPRTRDRWVFGCGAGIGDGALALWRIAAQEGVDAVWLTGSAREEADAAARGIPTLRKTSLRGFWATARARVVVVTHGFGDANRYAVSGAFVVQLWHGIPLKRIGLDSPATLRSGLLPNSALVRGLLALMYRRAAARIDVLPAASHLVRGRLESAFGLRDDRIVVTGEPRVDVLSHGTASERREAARATVDALAGAIEGRRLVLYAPTWRDGETDPAVPTAEEWAAIEAMLERNDAVLLVRSHPLGAGDYRPPTATDRVRLLGSDLLPDVTPVLPAMDVLVTDYSSLMFDASLVPLPVVFFAPDVDEYVRSRGLYGRYTDVAGDEAAPDWAQTLAQLDAVLGDPKERERRVEDSRERSRRVHDFRDGENARRVYRAVSVRLNPHPVRPAAPKGTS